MKNTSTSKYILSALLITFCCLFLGTKAHAQAPDGINYQAVIRNASGTLIANTTIAIRIQIKQTSASGTIVFQERHSVTTSAQGVVNLVIGQGTLLGGNFSTINWATGPYFVSLGVSFTNGTNYLDYGSQQLMSVPYALYAKNAGNQLNQWRYGTTVPAAALGTLGDFYLNMTDGNVYYKSNPTTWLLTGNITGPAGAAGATGATGAQGIQGVAGPSGAAGTNGAQGIQGLPGVPGPQGIQGLTGPIGAAGSNGLNGQNALVKTTLEAAGANCINGGVKVESGLDANTNGILDPAEVNALLTTFVCNGSAGAQGIQGLPGTNGTNGAVGATGPIGPTGLTGPAGAQGIQGLPGTNGAAGATGPAGPQGIQGLPGTNGTNGAVGATGPAGPQGIQGLTGPTGPTGAQGIQGATGLLPNGAAAGNTPYWNGTSWIVTNSNIHNNGSGVGIGTSNPTASAKVDIESTTQGFLPPRMTTLQRNAISSPAAGLRIFNISTGCENFYSGSSWIALCGDSLQNNTLPQGTTPGQILYWNGNQWQLLSPGSYGQTLNTCNGILTWGGCPPLVSTDSIFSISGTNGGDSRIGSGNVTNLGGSPVTARGLCYSTMQQPSLANSVMTAGSGAGIFSGSLTGLIPGTLYYVRAYATNAAGTSYGNQVSFMPLPAYINSNNQVVTVHPTNNFSGPWSTTQTFIGLQSGNDGAVNTLAIVANQGNGSYAAQVCNDLVAFGYSDWYLPSFSELLVLNANKITFNMTLNSSNYWSSNEYAGGGGLATSLAQTHQFQSVCCDAPNNQSKTGYSGLVRCIRR
jgi:hypothetical protein